MSGTFFLACLLASTALAAPRPAAPRKSSVSIEVVPTPTPALPPHEKDAGPLAPTTTQRKVQVDFSRLSADIANMHKPTTTPAPVLPSPVQGNTARSSSADNGFPPGFIPPPLSIPTGGDGDHTYVPIPSGEAKARREADAEAFHLPPLSIIIGGTRTLVSISTSSSTSSASSRNSKRDVQPEPTQLPRLQPFPNDSSNLDQAVLEADIAAPTMTVSSPACDATLMPLGAAPIHITNCDQHLVFSTRTNTVQVATAAARSEPVTVTQYLLAHWSDLRPGAVPTAALQVDCQADGACATTRLTGEVSQQTTAPACS